MDSPYIITGMIFQHFHRGRAAHRCMVELDTLAARSTNGHSDAVGTRIPRVAIPAKAQGPLLQTASAVMANGACDHTLMQPTCRPNQYSNLVDSLSYATQVDGGYRPNCSHPLFNLYFPHCGHSPRSLTIGVNIDAAPHRLEPNGGSTLGIRL